MKGLFVFSALLVLYQSSGVQVRGVAVDDSRVDARSDDSTTGLCVCGNPATYNVLYRTYSGLASDHFYTHDPSEITAAFTFGYSFQGDAALLFATQTNDTVPLYRLYDDSIHDHLYTTNGTEKDALASNGSWSLQSSPGYIYSSQICGSVPLYRLFNSGETDHFYTVNATERNNAVLHQGYTFESIIGYVPQGAGHVLS